MRWPHIVVGKPLALVSEYPELSEARCGFVERGGQVIGPPVRLDPLLVESRLDELTIRQNVSRAVNLLNLENKLSRQTRIETDIFIEIRVHAGRFNIVNVVKFTLNGDVLPVNSSRSSADELRRLLENAYPQAGVECRVVDIADQQRQKFQIDHPRHRSLE